MKDKLKNLDKFKVISSAILIIIQLIILVRMGTSLWLLPIPLAADILAITWLYRLFKRHGM